MFKQPLIRFADQHRKKLIALSLVLGCLMPAYALSVATNHLSYYCLFFILAYFLLDRKNLKSPWIYGLFGSFILILDAVHLPSSELPWSQVYWQDSRIVSVTAALSITTTLYLAWFIPKALSWSTQTKTNKTLKEFQLALQDKEIQLQALNKQFTTLLEAIPDTIFIQDAEGGLIFTNESARQLIKLNNYPGQGNCRLEPTVTYPEQHGMGEKFFAIDEADWDHSGGNYLEINGINDGIDNSRDFSVSKTPFFKDNGERSGMLVVGRDITDLKLMDLKNRIATATMESQEGVIITDTKNNILHVNQAFTRLTGFSAEEAIGKTPSILRSGHHDKAFYQGMWEKLITENHWEGEVWDRRKNGEIYPKFLTIKAVADSREQVTHYVGSFTDLSQNKEAEASIHRLAFYDPLTDLPNRRLFNDRLTLAIPASASGHAAIIMIDLDNFKSINDTKGHGVGDQLLVKVAKRLKGCVRQNDTLARLGGDEFIIVLENLDANKTKAVAQAERLGEKILLAVSKPYHLIGHTLHSSASVGISMMSGISLTAEELLKQADSAMYQAKNAGRNSCRLFDSDMHASLELRMSLESELHHALLQNQFQLYYQSQVDNHHQIIGAEVLLRWNHPQYGMVSPAQFIPIAEDNKLILPIGEWVLHTACLQLQKWSKNPDTKGLILAVNVSACQFSQPDYVTKLCKILVQTGANPELLKLEITESLVMHNVHEIIEKMATLKLLGVRFSMDDFGTGYSSLSYLKKLPLSQLKIDQSFVRDIITDSNDAIIVQTIIGMAGNLGLNVIAEGVETEEQRACLERLGCLVYQGYLFSKPIPLAEFETLLTEPSPDNPAGNAQCRQESSSLI